MTGCTYQGLADIKFEPIAGLVGADHEENLEQVTRITRAALDLLGKSKQEMIDMVRAMRKDKSDGSSVSIMLRELGAGKTKLEAMLEFVTAAQLRVASAAAVVYPEASQSAIDEAARPR
jgi:hypothetical protein